MGDKYPNSDIRPLDPTGSTSRIRLSKRLLSSLGWTKHAEDFECIGVFRTAGHLLVAPDWLETEEGNHPFEILFNYEVTPPAEEVMSLRQIPSLPVITAANRIVRFSSNWTKEKNQLDLKLSSTVTARLGWNKQNCLPIFPAVWGPVLCLISEEEFLRAQTEDFTNGHLR